MTNQRTFLGRARDRVATGLGLVTQDRAAAVSRSSYKEGFQEGRDYYGDAGEDEPTRGTLARQGYRSTTRGLRDFTQIDRERILEIVWTLVQSNPIADRTLEMKRDYILGRGVQFNAEDSDLQVIVDEFVKNNELVARLKEFVLQLFLFGVQCFPVFVRKTDGQVSLGYFDPAEIEEVIVHPDNSMQMWAIVIKERMAVRPWEKMQARRVYRIVRRETGAGAWDDEHFEGTGADWLEELVANWQGVSEPVRGQKRPDLEQTRSRYVLHDQAVLEPWEEELLGAFGQSEYSGTCIYVRVNSVSNQPYGYSDLLQTADWMDVTDETLFAVTEREQLASYFSWDVTVEGADDGKIRERAAELRSNPPKRGSVNVHNERETWVYNYANLQQAGSIEAARATMLHIFGGVGFPEHFYGRGDETNRATAQAQGDPTWRTLEHDQDAVRDLILLMLHLARDQAVLAGTWDPRRPVKKQAETAAPVRYASEAKGAREPAGRSEVIRVTMPEMTAKDMSLVATTLSTVAGALVIAQEQGWITPETSREMFAKAAAEFGVEIDLSEEMPGAGPAEWLGGQQPIGARAANHGVMWDGSGETGQPRSWSELTASEQVQLVTATMDRLGVRADFDQVSEVLTLLEQGVGTVAQRASSV